MQVAFATLGCKVNQFDTTMMESLAGGKGYQIVGFDTRADVYIINTCTVTLKSNYQSRQLVRKAVRQNPKARIIVTGCYAETYPDEIKSIPGVDVVLGNAYKKNILEYLEGCGAAEPQTLVNGFEEGKNLQQPFVDGERDRSRVFLKVQDGCNFRCTFCIIPKARGPSRSLPPQQIIDQITLLVNKGYNEIVLTGVYLGAYGRDIHPKVSLATLLQEISTRTQLSRIRLSSIDPKDFNSELIETLCNLPNLCHHLHIPLQSGDDLILKRMRRGYTTGFFISLVNELKKKMDDLFIGTDVMVGFPGEGLPQFENTYQLLSSLPITSFHVFPFSNRPGTPAARMKNQVPDLQKKDRAERLRVLSKQKEELFKNKFIGRTLPFVMLKGEKGPVGLSHNYLKVHLKGESVFGNSCIGQVINIQIVSVVNGQIFGSLPSRQYQNQ
ncbi:MAG TPA: tRNA (N(6)-L-threonylcarbamoyladenosine(37)-C(2))-methylthiotransferase MtaB [Nitrospiria bacterium]|jgi:threonylcarbamoyladenosine tRNA methylthiotransferase MtaB